MGRWGGGRRTPLLPIITSILRLAINQTFLLRFRAQGRHQNLKTPPLLFFPSPHEGNTEEENNGYVVFKLNIQGKLIGGVSGAVEDDIIGFFLFCYLLLPPPPI